MNIKISKELHEELCELNFAEFLFGSQLHGIATENSDSDYVRIIEDEDFYPRFTSLARYYPNIHSWQYTEGKEVQYVWMTETQFFRNLFSGDGNMVCDIVLLNKDFPYEDRLKICRSYKIIKGYLGVAKRDMKLHGEWDKKRFHAFRSLYMAECLMNNVLPTVEGIKALKSKELPSKTEILEQEASLRTRLNEMLNKGEITHYPVFEEEDELVRITALSNNILEFKYDK